jgi:hypothetical protein
VTSDRYAHAVHVDAGDWHCSDQYFPVAPGGQVRVRLTAPAGGARGTFSCRVSACNCPTGTSVGLSS